MRQVQRRVSNRCGPPHVAVIRYLSAGLCVLFLGALKAALPPLALPPRLAFTELMYQPVGGEAYEFIELVNLGATSADLGGTWFEGVTLTFPRGSSLAPGARLVLCPDDDAPAFGARYPGVSVAASYGGHMGKKGTRLALRAANGRALALVEFGAKSPWPVVASGSGHSIQVVDPAGEPSDPANWRASTTVNGNPGEGVAFPAAVVQLNEVLPAASDGAAWVELYNPGTTTVTLAGWGLAEAAGLTRRFVFPAGTALAPKAYLQLWCDTRAAEPGLHTFFPLPPAEGTVFLYDTQGGVVDAVSYGRLLTDRSLARLGGQWTLGEPTAQADNRAAVLADPAQLVFNEWLASSAPGAVDFVELYNRDPSRPTALRGLWLAISNDVRQLRWPLFIAPGGFVALNADGGPGPGHLAFKLPATGGFIGLYTADGTAIDRVDYGPQCQDLSEGRFPDGAAAIRVLSTGPTPGAANGLDTDHDGLPDWWEERYGLDPHDPGDAAQDRDGDGAGNLIEFITGTNPLDADSALRLRISPVANGTVQISWPAVLGRSYSLLGRNGAAGGSWLELFEAPVATNQVLTYRDSVASGASTRVYEVTCPRLVTGFEPAVSAVWPADGQTGAPASASLVISFREPVDGASLTTGALQVTDDLGRVVPGRLRFAGDYVGLSFEPVLPLAHETTYQVRLAGSVRFRSGRSVGSAQQWSFTTGAAADLAEDRRVYPPFSAAVAEVQLSLLPLPGGYTLTDVNNDSDPFATFHPSVAVHFQEGAFGAGQTNVNGRMRQRGQTVRLARQKSYRVNLNGNAGLWRSQRVVNLNKHAYDLTRLRNRLSFDLFAGLPYMSSLRTLFAHVLVDGQDYGLFTQIEQPDQDSLAAHGLDPNGQLYKATFFEFFRYPDTLRLKSDPLYDADAFAAILEPHGTDAHEKVLAMLDDLNNPGVPIDRLLAKYFSRNNYLTWLAMNILVGNLDTSSQNFLLYSPANDSAWYFQPWDYDGAWGFYDQPQSAPLRVQRWREGVFDWWGVVLHQRFFQQPENLNQLVGRVTDLAVNYFTAERVAALLNQYHNVVESYVTRAPDVGRLPLAGSTSALQQWNTEVGRLAGVVQQNYGSFLRTLTRPAPVFLGTPTPITGGLQFVWDSSFSLVGHPLTYDLQVSTRPDFQTVVFARTGLVVPNYRLTPSLPSGTYYYQVIIRDALNPFSDWQFPFDGYSDPITGARYDGVKQFQVP